MSEGRWTKTGAFCKWCGGEISVWVSDYDESGELPEGEFCSLMCQFEAISFIMRHR